MARSKLVKRAKSSPRSIYLLVMSMIFLDKEILHDTRGKERKLAESSSEQRQG